MYPTPIIQEIPVLRWFRGVEYDGDSKSSIRYCNVCGHHINLQKDGSWYCPLCDREGSAE